MLRLRSFSMMIYILSVLLPGIFAVSLACTAAPNKTLAAPAPLELKIEAGFEGKVKEGKWFPVKFTITNPGEDIAGDLAVHIANPEGGKDFSFVKHVELPKQTTKVVWMALPGRELNKNNNTVKFYKESVEKETSVNFVQGSAYIETGTVPEQSLLAGVAARDPDTLNFLSLLGRNGRQVQVVRINMSDFPAEYIMLDGFDVIAFNDVPTDSLKQDQVKAVTDWVRRGGRLILAGGAGYPKMSAAFEHISPVTFHGTVSVTKLPSLEALTGKQLVFPQPFTVSNAALKGKDSEAVVSEGQLPLFARRSHGGGEVWYAAYDLALNPLASWNGNEKLWQIVLFGGLQQGGQGNVPPQKPVTRDYWEINRALDYFPSLLPPAFGILLVIFLIYIILVAPVLYFILKRVDKREWAWAAIPLLSVVFTVGIYLVGASGRGAVLSQTLNMYELNETGGAVKTGWTAVFVPKGGKYEIDLKEKAYASPFIPHERGGNQRFSGTTDMYIYQDEGHTKIRFTDVPYWSIRKASLYGEGTDEGTGKFDYTAGMDSSGLKGEITNQTGKDLTDVHVIFGGQTASLGELKAGEKKQFSLTGVTGLQVYDIPHLLFPEKGRMDENMRERALLSTYLQKRAAEGESHLPVIVAFHKENRQDYRVNGEEVESEAVNLFAQEMEVSMVQNGKVYVPYGFIQPVIVKSNVTNVHVPENRQVIEMGKGEIELEYSLPEIQGAEYHRLNISLNPNPDIELYVWNEQKLGWEELKGSITFEYDAKNTAAILANGRNIRIRAVNNRDYVTLHFPEIALEGVVKQ